MDAGQLEVRTDDPPDAPRAFDRIGRTTAGVAAAAALMRGMNGRRRPGT
ncbi:hypothetical protein [Methylobacterium planeticum]|nr:hypothetical protein [Methylobacterium planeticum]